MIKITQDQYEEIIFLTRCVYYDLPYPISLFNYKQSVSLITGLRMNIFEMNDYNLVVICGTNTFRDWITDLRVGLRQIPKQHQQALSHIINLYKDMDIKKPLVIAGHSLGGSIAEYCASFFHDDVLCISFNGCPVNHLCKNKCSCNIINIANQHDILNFLCKLLPTKYYMKHLSSIYYIPDKFTLNPIKSHCDFFNFMNFNFNERKPK